MSIYVKNNKDFDEEPTVSEQAPPDERTVLSANLVEVERGREHFPYGYLPELPQRLLREAFGCYAADLYLAFAIVCRRAIEVSGSDAGEASATSFERLYDDAATLSGIDNTTRATLRAVLFGAREEPEIDADQAAVLIELVKDIFQQRYVRGAKLKRAIRMRRYFAHESQAERRKS